MGMHPGQTEKDVKVLATDTIESRVYYMQADLGGGPV